MATHLLLQHLGPKCCRQGKSKFMPWYYSMSPSMIAISPHQRVISWSSLDWDRGRWNQFDLVLGTAFDMGVHLANTWVWKYSKVKRKKLFFRYFLGSMMSTSSQITGMICCLVLYYVIMYDPQVSFIFNRFEISWQMILCIWTHHD